MASSPSAEVDVSALGAQLNGTALAPGAEGWDDARQAWNLAADFQPAAVVRAADADDVSATLRYAGEAGLRVATVSTGHAGLAFGDVSGTILLRTGALDRVEVDAPARRAHLGGGVLALAAAEATKEHDLTPLLGSAVDVGVAGFALGGGLGWLGRSYGLAANSIRSADLVLASGEQVHVDAETDPDLFWAIRGGGGSFGVVTQLELELYETGELLAGDVMFDIEHAPGIFGVYRDWAASAPPEVTSSIRLLTPPPIPAVPEPVRGRPMITVTAACAGDPGAAEELLAPLRGAAPTVMDNFQSMSASGLVRIHGDPEQPVPGLTTGAVLDELTPERFDAILEVYDGSALLQVDFRQLGGALAEAPPNAGAQPTLTGEFAVSAVGALMGPGAAEAVSGDLARLNDALAPAQKDLGFPNFWEEPGDGTAVFDAETHRRLRDIKGRVDPAGTIRAAHDIPPG